MYAGMLCLQKRKRRCFWKMITTVFWMKSVGY